EMITGEVGETVELNGVVDFNGGGGRRISNYKSGHDFEPIIRKLLETNGIIASEIKVSQGDN
ncbi:3346_t:CDS:2, partial [Gigaspora rosea]